MCRHCQLSIRLTKSLRSIAVVCGLAFGMLQPLAAQVDSPPPGPAPAEAPAADEPGVETLTHGPIHEAFANPADLDPTPGPVAPKEPPADVPEDPPDYMPEGAIWIPGYWVWDDDRDDFVWVTGVARVPPPEMRWVPGYFAAAEGGWQRVSGFWTGTDVAEVDYRPTAPPATLETGPSSPAPASNYFWIPGSWAYHNTGYRWQAGYWTPYQPNWIWVPARWVWTPGGFVYVPGFWDYQMAYRGQMFAPVYFQNAVYARPGWVYRPWCVIPTNNLFIHLWLRPRWGCYYFGNYYGAQFAGRGFVAWANLSAGPRPRYVYDPFYTYARVHYRQQGVDYFARVQGWHNYYAQHADLRPPRTWHEQQKLIAPGAKPAAETQLVAHRLSDVARKNDAPIKLAKLDDQARKTQQEHAQQLRTLNLERSRVEHHSGPGAGAGASAVTPRDGAERRPGENVARLTLPKSDLPATGRSTARVERGGANRTGGGMSVTPPKPTPISRIADGDRPTGGKRSAGFAGKASKSGESGNGELRGGDRPRASGVVRSNQLPQVTPPGPAADLPGVQPPAATGGQRSASSEGGIPSVAPPNVLPGAGRRPTPKVVPGSEGPGARNDIPRVGPEGKSVAPPARSDSSRPTFGRDVQGPTGPRTVPGQDKSIPQRTIQRSPPSNSRGASPDASKAKAKSRDNN